MDETTYVFDADGMVLGRLASAAADLLIKAEESIEMIKS